jgi:hypothetical protein
MLSTRHSMMISARKRRWFISESSSVTVVRLSPLSRKGLNQRIEGISRSQIFNLIKGLSDEYDLKKIIKVCKRHFACNGTVVDHAEWGEVIQFQDSVSKR